MRRAGATRGVAALLAVLGAAVAAMALSSQPMRRAAVDETTVATLEGGNRIFLELQAGPRDSYVSMALRYCGSETRWAAIEIANGGRQVRSGLFYAIPYEALSPDWRARAVAALFPGDGPDEEGWVHRVPEGDEGQSLESIAAWFTGDAALADDIAASNGIEYAPLEAGAEVLIPSAVLSAEFVRLMETAAAPPPASEGPKVPAAPVPVPPETAPAPSVPRQRAEPVRAGDLTFHEDATGSYAVYRLKPGEALYSAVVARFTGRLDPDEVAGIAGRIAEASGIDRVTSIPVGHRIRIPRDLILPEHLPRGDPQREEFEASLAAAEQHRITVRTRDLSGVTLILDAGHGGDDVGARRNGVHEDDYVYDIMCRVKALAERTTAARVMVTIGDRSSGHRPMDGPFAIDRDEYLMTSPVYVPRQPHVGTVGVHLRWYLANSYYRSLLARGVSPEKVVFVSIHADSLHPSVRGAMVYVPGQAFRGQTYGHVGSLYNRREVREARYVSFTRTERERSEGLSRRLARQVIRAFADSGLPVHPYEPIRDHVIRMRRAWTPAVIRTSQVPQSLLLEVVNLNNARDAALIKDPAFRQKAAAALLEAIRRHYTGSPGRSTTTTRAAH